MEWWATRCRASLTGLLAVSCNIVLCRWRTDVLFFFAPVPGAAVNFCKQPLHCARTNLRQNNMVVLLHSQQRNDSPLHLHICPDWLLSVRNLASSQCPFRPLLMPLIPDSCILILWWLLNHEFGFLFLFVELNI